MELTHTPGILIAAPASGSGKTAAACALMAAFGERGLTVRACKCGPDYIDPMFHREVLGMSSRNLDLFFSGREELRAGYASHVSGADLAVTEGVMGYYDGMALDSDAGSAYDVARTLGLPVLLVLPARGAALSLAATVRGIVEFRPDSRIRGILLNRVSGAVYPRLKAMLEQELERMGHPIPVAGYLPEEESLAFESRHLGLVTPEETAGLRERMRRAGQTAARTVDLETVLRIAREGTAPFYASAASGRKPTAEAPDGGRPENPGTVGKPGKPSPRVRVGVARDRAFCFSYPENLELLESLGCELIPFSPLSDPCLPEDLDGLILCGGYPELCARQLSENRGMLDSVRGAVLSGLPCIAECGGFMYLHGELEDGEGARYPMAGVIRGRTFPAGKLVRFGYVSVRVPGEGAPESAGKEEGFLRPGEEIRGHEFHCWDSTDCGRDCLAVKPDGRRRWECVHMNGTLFAGYPHLYLPSLPAFAERFVKKCRERRAGRGRGQDLRERPGGEGRTGEKTEPHRREEGWN